MPSPDFKVVPSHLSFKEGYHVGVARTLPKMSQRLPNIATIPEDVPMISEGCRMSWCEARNLAVISFACYLGLKRDI